MINKNTIKYFLICALCFLLVIFFASGCGGGGGMFGGGSSSGSSTRGQNGAVTFNFNSGNGKYIASYTSSIYISITGEGLSSATTKTAAYNSSAVTFENLPVGSKTAQISALDALGNTISSGRVSFIITGGKTTAASVSLGIVFTDSSFSPSSITVPANTTLYFYNAGNTAHRLSGSNAVFNNNYIASQSSTAVTFSSSGNYVCYLDSSSSGISCTITVGSPQITSISPASAASGDTVTITGSGFGSSQGTSTVTFNGTSVTNVTSWSDASIVCKVPAGASTGNVVVTNGSASSNGYAFTVYYLAYVVNNTSNSISVIRSSDNTVISTISGAGLNSPINAVVTPDGNYLYVTNSLAGVSVIRRSDGTLVQNINIGGAPDGITITPDGNYVYATMLEPVNSVAVIRTSDNAVVKTTAVGTRPYGPSCTTNGNFVYVPNCIDDTVSVMRTSDNTVTATIAVQDAPRNSAVSPDGNFVYIANSGGDQSVSVIRASDNTVTTNIFMGFGAVPFNLDVTPDSNYLYVVKNGTNSVAVIRASDNSITTSVNVGAFPYGIAVTPGGNYVYVTNNGSNNVSVIRTTDNTVVATVNVGVSPNGVAVAR